MTASQTQPASSSRVRLACGLALLATLMTAWLPAAAAPAHVHGQATLEVVLDGARLEISLHAPQQVLLGFERPPRGQAEHRAAERLQRQLKDGATLVRTTLAAGCVLLGERLHAPMLQPGAKADGEHAEIEAGWGFECLKPDELKALDLGLFKAFRRLERLEVLLVTPAGQRKQVHERTQPRVELAR